MATWSSLNLQNANSPLMKQLSFFHDHTLKILTLITVMVTYMLGTVFFNELINRYLLKGQIIKMIWTIMSAITLIFIAFPSLRILYLMDKMNKSLMMIKSIGHPWYWSYEYSNFKSNDFDAYMKPTNKSKYKWLSSSSYSQLNNPAHKYSHPHFNYSHWHFTLMNYS